MEKHDPEIYARFMSRDPQYAVPGGESPAGFFTRCRAVLEDIAARHASETIAIVTHGLVLDAAYRAASGLALEERRAGFLADKWDVYSQLASLESARGQPAAAFDLSERLRARQTLEFLARGHVARSDADGVLAGRASELRRHIDVLTRAAEGQVAGSLRGPNADGLSAGARLVLEGAQRQYAAVLVELKERDSRYARGVTADAATSQAVAAQLRPDEAMLEYLMSDSSATVFVITRDTLVGIPLGAPGLGW